MKNLILFLLLLLFPFLGNTQPPSSDYELVFSDEFDDGTIDGLFWYTSDCDGNGSQFYLKSNVVEENGNLKLIAKKEEVECNGTIKQYTSGRIHSNTSFLYGYYEIKAKLPSGNGYWPSFWMFGACQFTAYNEIDIFEFCGCDCTQYQAGAYFEDDEDGVNESTDGNGTKHPNKDIENLPNLCSGFHRYGVEWTPTYIKYFFDGVEKFSHTGEFMIYPLQLILQLPVDQGSC